MLNKPDFIASLVRANNEEVYKECRRYGRILADSEFDINEGNHKGSHRLITISHHGVEFVFHLHNGNVLSTQRI